MMLSDSDNYTQLTRDNLVTELTQLCSPASLRHILPSLTLHPGMFVIISPIQLLHSHKSSHAPTRRKEETCVVQGNDRMMSILGWGGVQGQVEGSG